MIGRALKLAFVATQVLWMLVILPGHVRGQFVLGNGPGNDSCCATAPIRTAADAAEASCCKPKHAAKPDQDPDRRSRCAVCFQAHGYTLPPVYDFDLAPTGLCALRKLIGPTRLHHQAVRPTYLANGPPATQA